MKYASLVVSAFVATVAACRSVSEPEESTHLRFEGAVTSDGRPIEGAKVFLESTIFVFTVRIAESTTDANGRYELTVESACEKNELLYASPGKSLILSAFHVGHEQLSNININRPLYCTSDLQKVDFILRKASQPMIAPERVRSSPEWHTSREEG